MNFVTSSMSNIYQNCPDGKDRYLYFKFVDGKFEEMRIGEGESPQAGIRGFRRLRDIRQKSPGVSWGRQKALMTMKLKLKGNMVKALRPGVSRGPAEQGFGHHSNRILNF